MNKRLFIFCFLIPAINLFAVNGFAQTDTSNKLPNDTATVNVAKEDLLITEVVESKAAPQKDKVQYFNQVTKYGFKNLFSHYDYNPSMAYTAQVNPNAELFIQDYMRTHGKYLQGMKGWGMPYFNLIDNILQQYGLPRELKYIAVIESNLKTEAISNKGACGPWQFMPGTARQLGLTINPYVDERTDYYKSTNAAARYLLALYQQFHDWLLVMAAYNGGTARVLSAIKRSGSNDFWKLQLYLPDESRTYVKRFIATHYIMEGCGGVTTNGNFSDSTNDSFFDNTNNATITSYGQSNGLNPYNRNPNLSGKEKADVQKLSISGKYNGAVIAKNIGMDISTFNHYNPSFDSRIAANGDYTLQLPADKMQLFTDNKYPILNESVQQLLRGVSIPDNKTVYAKPYTPAKPFKKKTTYKKKPVSNTVVLKK